MSTQNALHKVLSAGVTGHAVARFRDDLNSLADVPLEAVALCVSGGPDSLALLLLARATVPDVIAATVNHGLRAEAADEARFVASLCTDLGVPHTTLMLEPYGGKGNMSDWARRARYRALDDWCLANGVMTKLTAHHADDQLETMLMRLNRGSGVAGLAGVRARHVANGVTTLRPLLGWRKAELEALVRDCGVIAVDDPSNHDDRYDRARLRKVLADADWLDPVAVARSAAALADADDALAFTTERLQVERMVVADGTATLDVRDLPAEFVRRLTLIALAAVNPDAAPRGEDLTRLIAGLAAGKPLTLAGVKIAPMDGRWHFTLAPKRAVRS